MLREERRLERKGRKTLSPICAFKQHYGLVTCLCILCLPVSLYTFPNHKTLLNLNACHQDGCARDIKGRYLSMWSTCDLRCLWFGSASRPTKIYWCLPFQILEWNETCPRLPLICREAKVCTAVPPTFMHNKLEASTTLNTQLADQQEIQIQSIKSPS